MPIEHINLRVKNLKKSRDFYCAALKPLRLTRVVEEDGWVIIGDRYHLQLGLTAGKPTSPIHLAFRTGTRAAVDKFYQAALEAGAKDNGKPGLREYSKNYYAAFVIDPNGHNLEAVCYAAPSKKGNKR